MLRNAKQKYFVLFVIFLFIQSMYMPTSTVANSSSPAPPEMEERNVALYKKVTSSVQFSNLSLINDGVISTESGGYAQDWPEGGGLQWVQIDLGKTYEISSIHKWRYWDDQRTYNDVIVQLSNDQTFEENVTTVFNNDQDNSAGLGVGTDEEYPETSEGKTIEFDTTDARYVRVYSAGNEHNINNHYVEIQVMGKEQLATEVPEAPNGYAYPMGTSRINASWEPSAGAYWYDIEVDGKIIKDVTIPYSHTDLGEETTHTYRVRAKNHLGESEWSEPFQSTTLASVEVGSRFMGPEPGKALGSNEGKMYELRNSILSVRFNYESNKFEFDEFQNKLEERVDPITVNELFSFELNDKDWLSSDDFSAGKPNLIQIKGVKRAKVSDRYDGWKLEVPFTYVGDDGKKITVVWSATLRDSSNYLIQDVTYTAEEGDWDVTKFKLIDITGEDVEKAGQVDGSPFFAGKVFFAQQTPVARGSTDGDTATAYVDRGEETFEGESFKQSSVIGIYPGNQKWRAFQYYLDRERAQEHKNFLHYNSWYDLSWITDAYMTEENALDTIDMYGEKFINRGAPLQNFLFDDGYDDYSPQAENIWDFNKETFPNGARLLKEATEQYGTTLGFWLSPTGGYYHKLPARIAIGKRKEKPYETKISESAGDEIFTLSGPNYYEGFKAAVTKKQLQEGTKHFKFDRTEGIEDFHAFLRLSEDMRENDPEVFINTTVGTWASPFFTLSIDSIWRGGGDMGLSGTGTNRQQWINYRDQVSRNLLQQNPFYPLNSLMNHGIVHARFGQAAWVTHEGGTESGQPLDMTDEQNLQDFKDEVWSYFASGYNLQELYIRPTSNYTTEKMWDILAEASAWADVNHKVLMDSHFIGGDPSTEVYGIASYADTKSVLMLRNPSDVEKSITINVKEAFLLPENVNTDFTFENKLDKEADRLDVKVGESYTFTLPAHSMLLYEAYPEEVIDKSKLSALIKAAKTVNLEDYTKESVKLFEGKLKQAIAVYEEEASTQKEVDQAVGALEQAQAGLEKKQVDKSVLEKLVEDAEKIDTSLFTEASVDNFNEKVAHAKKVAEDKHARQSEVDQAIESLQHAVEQLEEKATDVNDNKEQSSSDEEATDIERANKGDRLPDTATPFYNWMIFGLLLMGGGVVLFAVRKRMKA